jgi:hypothetical protein
MMWVMKVGLLHLTLLDGGGATAAARLARMADAGIDHVACGDHVSFGGVGFDGLVQAAAIAALHPTLPISTGVYLLPLRIPRWSPGNWPTSTGSPRVGSSSGSASAARTGTRSRSAAWTRPPGVSAWTSA